MAKNKDREFEIPYDGDTISSNTEPQSLSEVFENYEPPKRLDVIGIDAVTKIISALTHKTSSYKIDIMTDSHQAQKEDKERAFILEIWEV